MYEYECERTLWKLKKCLQVCVPSSRNLFTSELRAAQSSSETELLKVKEIEEWEAILEKNCEWNKKTAITRFVSLDLFSLDV